jgi:type I restriction enzyme M protein
LKTLAARGFGGLVEAWTSSIVAAVENGSSKEHPLDHKLVRQLLPEHIDEVSELEVKKADLEATIKSAQQTGDDDDDDDDGEEEEAEEALPEEERKAFKKELAAVRRSLKAKQHGFLEALEDACADLGEAGARDVVLTILRDDLEAILKRYVSDHKQRLIAVFEGWFDKYFVTLDAIELERNHLLKTLKDRFQELGYA